MSSPLPLVVFAGAATVDAIAVVPRFPEADERQIADEVVYAGGGPAATAAVTASRLGVPSAFVGSVGEDDEGARIIDGLRAEGVDVSGMTVRSGCASGASVIVVDRRRATRAICSRPAPPVEFSQATELLRSAAWLHVDHIGWRAGYRYLQQQPNHVRPCLSVDAGYPIDAFTARNVDLFAPTDAALCRMYGEEDIDAALRRALADGAKVVVATRGSRGSAAATADGRRYAVAGLTVDVVSTLGAGDVFHGALVSAMARELPLRQAMSYAGIAAALSCREIDGRSAIPGHDEVLARLGEPKESA